MVLEPACQIYLIIKSGSKESNKVFVQNRAAINKGGKLLRSLGLPGPPGSIYLSGTAITPLYGVPKLEILDPQVGICASRVES